MMSEPATILVVEDDFDIRLVMQLALEGEGYRVVTAGDGQEALEHLRSNELPSLILLDLMMPRMDGTDFRAVQRQDPALAGIPVVVLSADTRINEKAVAIGVESILRKPIDLDALLELVQRYCGQSESMTL